MSQLKTNLKTSLIAGLAGSMALLAACTSTPVTPGNPGSTSLSAIAVSKITPDDAVSAHVSLSWAPLSGEVKTAKFFRRRADQSADESQEITKLDDLSSINLDDKDPSLAAGVEYIYSIRGDNADNIPVVSAESQPIAIINAESVKPFAVTKPAENGATLKDPLGKGHEFTWEDAGTGLYHVKVSDTSGKVLWGAITTATTITYGTASGKNPEDGSINPKLAVPQALTQELTISSPEPNSSRNEVKFQGIGSTGQYLIQVSAIETQPNKGDLMSARSIAIRQAKEVRFIAQ